MPYPYTYPFRYDLITDFTVDDTMSQIRYELDDREIYNDIRSEIGILITETVLDTDPTYSWKWRHRSLRLAPGQQVVERFIANLDAIEWKLGTIGQVYARTMPYETSELYYDFSIILDVLADGNTALVTIKNTGSRNCKVWYAVAHKYLSADEVTHEEQVHVTLTVRATNAASIAKYGRRVMNLTWTEGTEEGEMQILVNHYVDRYVEPVARLRCTVKGSTDILRTQIITREISDQITVVCTNLGLYAECFINSISISDDPAGIPVCIWGLEIQRIIEYDTLFILDTGEIHGSHILGS